MTDREYLKKYLPSDKYDEGLSRYMNGESPQYIVGNVNFYGNELIVNKNVLIPRFETELLVDKTINYIREYFDKKVSIIDLGTGSGAIAISLAKSTLGSVSAIDISLEALEVAQENAKNNNAIINFYQSDMFSNVSGRFDVIISNPPYIAYDEEVEDVVLNNEPHIALFADNDGLFFYEEILSKASDYINEKALIAFEIGRFQGEVIKNIARKYFPNADIRIEKDYPGEDRFVFIFV